MLKEHYKITTDIARVYKVRGCVRYGWGWAVATIREFLCGLNFDYFMNKAATKGYRVFDEEATVRGIKSEIFDLVKRGDLLRETAHEWRDELDEIGDCGDEHLFAQRLMELDWFYRLYEYPTIEMNDCPRCRAFWDGPWQALCTHWRSERAAETLPEAA